MSALLAIPVIGAAILATGTIIERIILKKRKVSVELYQSSIFLTIMLALFPFIFFFWKLDPQVFGLKNLGIFALVILFSIIANRFAYYAMKWEKLSNIEPAKVLEPLFTILLAIIFSFVIDSTLYERNLKVIIPAIIAGLALIFSHVRKHHLDFNKYFVAAIIGSFFFALELVTSRLILDFFSPITFYFFRCLFIFVIALIFFRHKYSNLTPKLRWELLGLGFLWAFYRVMVYYGYLELGVAFTTLMVMLGPLLIYVFAWKFLKEKLDWRNIVAAGVIVAAVLFAILA